jgi:alpha-maltose-1-phosphate synthase
VREATAALIGAGLLSEFWTSVYWRQDAGLNRVLPHSIRRELNRRTFPRLSARHVHCHPWLELGRLTARGLRLSRLIQHETGRFSVDAVYRALDARVASRLQQDPAIDAVYAYEDGAWASFRTARQLGVTTIYELPIGYWSFSRRLLEEEAVREPEWASTLRGNHDSAEKLSRKDEELALADHILVPSEFVRKTLSAAASATAPISVIPYGAPLPPARKEPRNTAAGKLKVIFVGALSQRKGLTYLLRAVERFKENVTLTLIGRKVGECRAVDRALHLHRWIPSLPHAEVLEEIRRHDVMVFPSLFEGFGLVILEAMSQGVPVIATIHCAAPDFLSDGDDGFLVPIRDADAIGNKLELLLSNRSKLSAMSEAAICKATLHSWQRYREELVATVGQIIGRSSTEMAQVC